MKHWGQNRFRNLWRVKMEHFCFQVSATVRANRTHSWPFFSCKISTREKWSGWCSKYTPTVVDPRNRGCSISTHNRILNCFCPQLFKYEFVVFLSIAYEMFVNCSMIMKELPCKNALYIFIVCSTVKRKENPIEHTEHTELFLEFESCISMTWNG